MTVTWMCLRQQVDTESAAQPASCSVDTSAWIMELCCHLLIHLMVLLISCPGKTMTEVTGEKQPCNFVVVKWRRCSFVLMNFSFWHHKISSYGTSLYQRVKMKLSLLHATKLYRRTGGMFPPVLNLSTRWRWVASLTPRPPYPLEGTNSRSWRFGEERHLL